MNGLSGLNVTLVSSRLTHLSREALYLPSHLLSSFSSKNVDDFTGPRERSDLGFVTFDISANILLTEQTTAVPPNYHHVDAKINKLN